MSRDFLFHNSLTGEAAPVALADEAGGWDAVDVAGAVAGAVLADDACDACRVALPAHPVRAWQAQTETPAVRLAFSW